MSSLKSKCQSRLVYMYLYSLSNEEKEIRAFLGGKCPNLVDHDYSTKGFNEFISHNFIRLRIKRSDTLC